MGWARKWSSLGLHAFLLTRREVGRGTRHHRARTAAAMPAAVSPVLSPKDRYQDLVRQCTLVVRCAPNGSVNLSRRSHVLPTGPRRHRVLWLTAMHFLLDGVLLASIGVRLPRGLHLLSSEIATALRRS